MKNIHVLPTDKPSRLYYFEDKLVFGTLSTTPINRNIYITSDEEIKKGWYINIHTKNIVKGSDVDENWKRIILTTDQDLIKDGVQAIDDEFLEWFVKNPSCEDVEVKDVYFHGSGYYDDNQLSEQEKALYSSMKEYKIIIPKEEPKQETLEYVILQHIKMCLECNNESQAVRLLEKYGFEKQEELYNEKEVELIANEMVNWAIDNVGNPNPQSGRKFDEVIAKFKNK